jgi:ribosomal-protein-alanine N-acetyltransferase
MKIFIETERLLLRELLPSDDKGMFELDSDPEVHKYLGNKPQLAIEESRKVIEFIRKQYADNGIGRWAMVQKETGEFIGWAGLKYMTVLTNGHINYYDLGYRLMRRHWEKGYATEAAKASLEYGLNELKQHKLYAMADINNAASRHVLKKIGFKQLAVFEYEGSLHHWFEIEKTKAK